ncbi:MAG: hypothetical protein OEY66_04970 [Gammaproteobacteria bacterium]|nr:hypothetical protein [Gammaproteobacteria bacterium]
MKFLVVLAILSITTAFNSAYATEAGADSDNVTAYCEEQAQLAGIEDNIEKQEYIKDCAESYASPSDGGRPTE